MAHEHRLRVYWEDTDAGGIVYYANYLKFVERGRTEALLALGLSQTELRQRLGLIFVVRRIAIEFHGAARLEDQLLVSTSVAEIGGARLAMVQEVRREEAVLAHCEVALAVVGDDGRPRRIPQELRERLRELGNGAGGV